MGDVDDVRVMQLRGELIEVGKRLDGRLLVAGTEGNVSARLDEDTLLITRSGTMLGRLQHSDLLRVRISNGQALDRFGRPTSELGAHLEAYRADRRIGAIIHAHPKSCVALTLRGWTLEAVPLPEAAYALGSVPTCAFAVPGSEEGGEVMKQWASKRDALLFDRHGAFTFGGTPFAALARMEMLDAVAQIVLLAGGPDQMKPLARDEIERVADVARKAGAHADGLNAWVERLRAT